MDSTAAYSSYEIMRLLTQYGFIFLSIIDSLLVVISSRYKFKDDMPWFPGWLNFHYKHGIWKVNTIKILISILIPYPELALNPQVGLLFFYLLHVLIFSYKIFRSIRKNKVGDTP